MNIDSFAWSTYSQSSIFLCSFKAVQFQPNISDNKAYLTPFPKLILPSASALSHLFSVKSLRRLFRCSASVSSDPIIPPYLPTLHQAFCVFAQTVLTDVKSSVCISTYSHWCLASSWHTAALGMLTTSVFSYSLLRQCHLLHHHFLQLPPNLNIYI